MLYKLVINNREILNMVNDKNLELVEEKQENELNYQFKSTKSELEEIIEKIRRMQKRKKRRALKKKIYENLIIIVVGLIGGGLSVLFINNEDVAAIFVIISLIVVIISLIVFSILFYFRYFSPKKTHKSLKILLEKKAILEKKLNNFKVSFEIERLLIRLYAGDRKFDLGDFSNALLLYQTTQNELNLILKSNSNNVSLENIRTFSIKKMQDTLEHKIILAQNKLNEQKFREINPIIEQGNLLKNQNLNEKAIEAFKKALEITNNLFESPERDQKIKEIKSLIDPTYLNKIKEINAKGNQLRNQNKFDRAIQTFRNALQFTDNIYSSSKRKKEVQNIENLINQAYSNKIIEKIKTGNQLRKQMKFDESIKTFNKGLNLTKKMYESSEKNNEISEIKSLINQSKIAKIKNTILNLGTKFGRLHIMEISEECGEDEGLIISTVREMIKVSEIYAKYFESSKSVAFDQQANIKEIDKLMESYKDWEEKGIGKK